MKKLGPLLCGFFSIVAVYLSSETLAQNKPKVPPHVNQSLSVSELVDWLDKTSFSHARIGLEFTGAESYTDDADLSIFRRLSEELIFSPGFRLVNAEGCHLTLKNDQVEILSAWTRSYDAHQMSFAKFLFDGKKGERKLTPQSAVLFIPLDKLRYKGGRKPYRYTKNPEEAKLLGTWRTKFKEKGFFRRSVLQMEITAAEQKEIKDHMNAETLTFTFDDKEMSEKFDAAFRQAIKLCSTE